jgi:hypothetical protein
MATNFIEQISIQQSICIVQQVHTVYGQKVIKHNIYKYWPKIITKIRKTMQKTCSWEKLVNSRA